jgi:hypothetical protein
MGTLKVARFFKAFAPIRACPIGATRVGEIQKTSSQPRTPHSSSAGGRGRRWTLAATTAGANINVRRVFLPTILTE